MRRFSLLLALSLLSVVSKAQMSRDTMNLITIFQVDKSNRMIYAITRYFFINGKYYYGKNFPFDPSESDCILPEVIASRSIKHLVHRLKENVSFEATDTTHVFSAETKVLLQCIGSAEREILLVSEQKVVAFYSLKDCGTRRGVHDPVYCIEKIDMAKTPVILEVIKILDF